MFKFKSINRRIYRNVTLFLIALLLGGGMVGIVIDQPTGNGQTRKQNTLATVPNPRDAEIRRIRSAEEWPNPYVVVYSDGFEGGRGRGGGAGGGARGAGGGGGRRS